MRTDIFHRWLSQASELTPSQREQALMALSERRQLCDLMAAIEHRRLACPRCGHTHLIHWGNAHGLPRYRCAACHRTFNALSATPLARLRRRDCWAEYAQALIDGLTARKAALHCGVHKNTAFRWRHRFLSVLASAKPEHLHGIVEADETYFLESFKGKRHFSRPPRKRDGVATKYLPNYLGWRRCLERFPESLSPKLVIVQAIGVDQHLAQT